MQGTIQGIAIIAVAAVAVPTVISLLLELEKRLARTAKSGKHMATVKRAAG